MSSYNELAFKKEFTVLASAVRTATANSDTLTNDGWKGVTLFLDVTAETGAITLTPKIQTLDPIGGTWADLATATFGATTAVGTTAFTLYPGITSSAGVSEPLILPKFWRVVATMSGTTNMTYSIGACYHP